MRSSSVSLALLAGLAASVSAAERNVTIDDFQRELITYSPPSAWTATSDGATTDRYLQTTTYSRTQGSFATFSFTGTAIYYVGYGEITNNFPSLIRIELDGTPTDVPSSLGANVRPAQQILFAQRGLTNSLHTIVVRKTSDSGGRDVNIDAFVYTVVDGDSPSSGGGGGSNSNTGTGSQSNNTTQGSSGVSIGGIVGGVIGGIVLGAVLVLGTILFMRRRRKAAKSQKEGVSPYMTPGSGAGSLRPGAPGAYSPNARPMTMFSQHTVLSSQHGSGMAGLGAGPNYNTAQHGGVLYGAVPQSHTPPTGHGRNLSATQLYPTAPSNSSVRSGPYSYQPEPFRPVPQPADAAPWASPSTPPPPSGASGGSRKYVPPAFPGTTPITQ